MDRYPVCVHGVIALAVLLLSTVGNLHAATRSPKVPRPSIVASDGGYVGAVHREWKIIEEWIAKGDFSSIEESVGVIKRVEAESGIRSVSALSFDLLDAAKSEYRRGRRDAALYYLKQAKEISPNHLEVALRALPLTLSLEGESILSVFRIVLGTAHNSPTHALLLISALLVPVCVVASGVVLLLLLYSVAHGFLALSEKILSPLARGEGGAWSFVTATLVIIPIYLGPMWTLALWGYLLAAVTPARWKIVTLAGGVLILWGSLVPLRENIALWGADPELTTAYSIVMRDLPSEGDVDTFVTIVSPNPTVRLAQSVLFRLRGDYASGRRTLQELQRAGSMSPEVSAELGAVSFLTGAYRDADSYYAELGDESAAALLNRSKAKFSLLDVDGGKNLFSKARAVEPTLVVQTGAREAYADVNAERVLVDVFPGLSFFVGEALVPRLGAAVRSDAVISSAMPGTTPPLVLGMGVLLLGLGLWRSRTSCRRERPCSQALASLLRLLPGGGFVLSDHEVGGALLLSPAILLLLLGSGFPADFAPIPEEFPEARIYFFGAGILLLLFVSCAGYLASEEGGKC